MIRAEVPAWTAVALAAIPGVLGLIGVFGAGLMAARAREKELSQERQLHGAEARLEALDAAATAAIAYRERVGASLSLVAHSKRPRLGVEPLWLWDRTDVLTFLRHDAALTLRYGRNHEVPTTWRVCAWKIAEATEFARQHRGCADEPADKVPSPIKRKAKSLRREARKELERFLDVASKPFKECGPESDQD
jgi:hypothetical protein